VEVAVVIVLVIIGCIGLGVVAALFRAAEEGEVRHNQRRYWDALEPPREPAPPAARCPKCDDVMVQGFVPDMNYQQIGISIWVEGRPRRDWCGTDADWERSVPIGTFRCRSCGFLEWYARPEFRHE
jgi:hypothetical protein